MCRYMIVIKVILWLKPYGLKHVIRTPQSTVHFALNCGYTNIILNYIIFFYSIFPPDQLKTKNSFRDLAVSLNGYVVLYYSYWSVRLRLTINSEYNRTYVNEFRVLGILSHPLTNSIFNGIKMNFNTRLI